MLRIQSEGLSFGGGQKTPVTGVIRQREKLLGIEQGIPVVQANMHGATEGFIGGEQAPVNRITCQCADLFSRERRMWIPLPESCGFLNDSCPYLESFVVGEQMSMTGIIGQ